MIGAIAIVTVIARLTGNRMTTRQRPRRSTARTLQVVDHAQGLLTMQVVDRLGRRYQHTYDNPAQCAWDWRDAASADLCLPYWEGNTVAEEGWYDAEDSGERQWTAEDIATAVWSEEHDCYVICGRVNSSRALDVLISSVCERREFSAGAAGGLR